MFFNLVDRFSRVPTPLSGGPHKGHYVNHARGIKDRFTSKALSQKHGLKRIVIDGMSRSSPAKQRPHPTSTTQGGAGGSLPTDRKQYNRVGAIQSARRDKGGHGLGADRYLKVR